MCGAQRRPPRPLTPPERRAGRERPGPKVACGRTTERAAATVWPTASDASVAERQTQPGRLKHPSPGRAPTAGPVGGSAGFASGQVDTYPTYPGADRYLIEDSVFWRSAWGGGLAGRGPGPESRPVVGPPV